MPDKEFPKNPNSFENIKGRLELLEKSNDFDDEKNEILNSLDSIIKDKKENFHKDIREIHNNFAYLQDAKNEKEVKASLFLIKQKFEKIEKNYKKLKAEENKIKIEELSKKGSSEITDEIIEKTFGIKNIDDLSPEEKKEIKKISKKVSEKIDKKYNLENNSEIEINGVKYRVGDEVYYKKNTNIKYKIKEIRKNYKNAKNKNEINDITLVNDVYNGLDMVKIEDIPNKISKEKFPEEKPKTVDVNLEKIDKKEQNELEIDGVLYKVGEEVFYNKNLKSKYRIKEIRKDVEGNNGRIFNDLILENVNPKFKEVRVIQITDVKKEISKQKKDINKNKEKKQVKNPSDGEAENKENIDTNFDLKKKYKKGEDVFILVAGDLIKKVKISDIKENEIHYFDKASKKVFKLKVEDFKDFSNISKDKKELEDKIKERIKNRKNKESQNEKVKKQNNSSFDSADVVDFSKKVDNNKKISQDSKVVDSQKVVQEDSKNNKNDIEDLAKNALGDNWKEELIKIYKEKILNKEKEEKLIEKIKNILGSEYTKEIGEKIKDKIIEISIKEKKEHHDSDIVIAYVSKEVLEEEKKPKYPKSHSQEFYNNLENFTPSKNPDPKIRHYEPVKTVEKSNFNKAEAWKSIFEYINENKDFEKQAKDVQEDLKNILMLIEANDEKLLKQYFEKSTEPATKKLFESDPKFAWIFKLGEKKRVAVIEDNKKISQNQAGKPKLETVNEFNQEIKSKGKFSARRMLDDDFSGLGNYDFVSSEIDNTPKQETEEVSPEEIITQENNEIKSTENIIDKNKELRKNSLKEEIEAIDSYFRILNSLKKLKISDGFSLTKMIDQEKDPERKKSLSEVKEAFMIVTDNLGKLNIDYSNFKKLEKLKKQLETELNSLDKPAKESYFSRIKNKIFSKESPEEKAEAEKNNQEKAKTIGKTLVKVIYGSGTSVTGVKFLADSAGWLVGKAGRKFFDKDLGWGDIDQYFKNELKNENVKKELENTFSEFVDEFQKFVILNTEINEKERTEITERDNQVKHEMRDKIKSLREKILNSPDLSEEEKTRFKKVLSEILRQNHEKNESEEKKQKESIKNIIDAFVYNKISKMTILKDALNTALVASGQFALRGVAYALTSTIERSLKANQEFSQENSLTQADMINKVGFVLGDLLLNSSTETVRSLAGMGAKKDSKTKKTDFIKAVGKIFTALGIYGVAFGDTDISGAFDRLTENIKENGILETAVDNFKDNIDRLRNLPGQTADVSKYVWNTTTDHWSQKGSEVIGYLTSSDTSTVSENIISDSNQAFSVSEKDVVLDNKIPDKIELEKPEAVPENVKPEEILTEKIEKAPIIAASYEIKSGQGLSHAIYNFEKNPEFKEEIIEALAKDKGLKLDDLNQGQKEKLFRDWKIGELQRHGYDFTKTGEHYNQTLYKGAKINLVWEGGYPEVRIAPESIDKTAFFHDDKFREFPKEEILATETGKTVGGIGKTDSAPIDENITKDESIKYPENDNVTSKIDFENLVKIKGKDSLEIIQNTKNILKGLSDDGDKTAGEILAKIEKIESIEDGPDVDRSALVEKIRNEIRKTEYLLGSKNSLTSDVNNENLQNAVKDLGNKQEASVNSKEVSATDKFSGSSTTEENIVKDEYFKEKGITLDKKANVYDVFTKGDKVLYKNAYDILYNRDGKRIGFLGEDGAFHLHEPKGGYPKNSLEDVGIIKNKYEGQNGIKDFSNYKNPLDEENVDSNINKTEKTNPPTTEENASKEEVVVKDTQKPIERQNKETGSPATEENTTEEADLENASKSDSSVNSVTERSARALAYKSTIENKLVSNPEFKPYKDVFKKAVSFIERDLNKLKILVEKNPNLGLDNYTGRVKDLEQTILALASEENSQNNINNQIKGLWAVDSAINSDIKILEKNLGLFADDDNFAKVKEILEKNNKVFEGQKISYNTGQVSDISTGQNLQNFQNTNGETQNIGEMETRTEGLKRNFSDYKKDELTAKSSGIASSLDNSNVFEEQDIPDVKSIPVTDVNSAQELRSFAKVNTEEAKNIGEMGTRKVNVDTNLAQRMNLDKKLEEIKSPNEIPDSNQALKNFGEIPEEEAQKIEDLETGNENIRVNNDEAFKQVLPEKEINYYNLDKLGTEEIKEKVSEIIKEDENLKNISSDIDKKVKIKADLFSDSIADKKIDTKDYLDGVKLVEIPERALKAFAPDLSTDESTAAIIDGLLSRSDVDSPMYTHLKDLKLASMYKAYADKLEKIAGNEEKVKFLRDAAKKIITGKK